MNRILGKIRARWVLITGAAAGVLFATNKMKNLYWGLLGVIFFLKLKGYKIFGKNNPLVVGLVLLYFLYCFASDMMQKQAIGSEKVEGLFDALIKKTKNILGA